MKAVLLIALAVMSGTPPFAFGCAPSKYYSMSVAEFRSRPSGYNVWRGPFTAEQVEAVNTIELALPEIRPVVFGDRNAEWVALRTLERPGDRYYEFATRYAAGYALVCDETIIDIIITAVS